MRDIINIGIVNVHNLKLVYLLSYEQQISNNTDGP